MKCRRRKHTSEEIIDKLSEPEVVIVALLTLAEATIDADGTISKRRPSTAGAPNTAASASTRPSHLKQLVYRARETDTAWADQPACLGWRRSGKMSA